MKTRTFAILTSVLVLWQMEKIQGYSLVIGDV